MRGFKINVCIMDGEFDVLRDFLAGLNIYLSCTGRDEHLGDIELHILPPFPNFGRSWSFATNFSPRLSKKKNR